MQCPRCGLQNQPDITACARCGLPVPQGPPPQPGSGAAPGGASTGSTAAAAPPPAPPASGGYGSPAYGPPAAYGAPPAAPGYAAPTAPYPPSPGSQQPPPSYGAPYGTLAGSPYATGPVAPYAAPPMYAGAAPSGTADSRDRTAGLVRLVLLLGALTSVGYAIWALTARRGIFADFADNRSVSLDDAKTSDRLDTIFLVVAAAIAVIALALWVVRLMSGRARSGALTLVGFVISALGLVCVVVGLVMSGLVGDGGNRITEGEDAMTATIVTGSGFIALAIGLLIGCLVIAQSRSSVPSSPTYQDGAPRSEPAGSDDTVVGPSGW